MTYIDIAILAIIGLFAIIGFARGMFKTILSLFGTVVCLVLAWFLASTFIDKLLEIQMIDNWVFGESGSIYTWIKGALPAFEGLTVGDSEEVIKSSMDGVWSMLAPLIYNSVETLNNAGEYSGMPLQNCVAHIFAKGIFFVLLFLAVFIILKIIMSIITAIINALRKSSTLRSIDRLLGFGIGAVSGALFVAVLLAVMSFFISAEFMSPFRKELEKSVIAQPVSGYVGDFIEKNINVEALTGGLVPNKPTPHTMIPAEETAVNTLNVFGEMDMFSPSSFPRSEFTAANYDLEVQVLVNDIESLVNDCMLHIQNGDYVMEIDTIQEHAYEIKLMYSDQLSPKLTAYKDAKTSGNQDDINATLAEVKTTLQSIKNAYLSAFQGETKIPGLTIPA